MNSENQNNRNKRIVKNTLFLYTRMLIIICVNLYTSRIVLEGLGVSEYGIYSVVGGFVAMFSIISGSISAAISRYLTFELGKGNLSRLKIIFASSVSALIAIFIIVLIVAESFGVWFINNKMDFPKDSMFAVNVVFQVSLVSFGIKLLSQPYNAAIIAHEKMSAFAYISIVEAIGALLIAYAIVLDIPHKLIIYTILMGALTLIIRLIYTIYCKRHFDECTFKYSFNKECLKEMFGFAGWNFIGAASGMLRDQGGNILINIFFGTAVNAATGIALQVNHALNGFVSNFMTALNPQITKSYATDDYRYMAQLIFKGARFSFFLLLLLSFPVIVNIDYILKLWLTTIPPYTSTFIRLTLVFALSESISQPLITTMLATGKIRNYQIVVGGVQLLNLPLSYLLLRMGYGPQYVYIISIILSQICLLLRLILLQRRHLVNIKLFFNDEYLKVAIVTAISFMILFIPFHLPETFKAFLGQTTLLILWSSIVILGIGINKNERSLLYTKFLNLTSKLSTYGNNCR